MKALSYSDIYLVPRYSELKSRGHADVSVEFLGRRFNLPVLPANMTSVINDKIAKWCSEHSYFYIMHRFGDTKAFVERANREGWRTISISVGVKQEDRDLIAWLKESRLRVDYITIDVAHADHILVQEMIEYIHAIHGWVKADRKFYVIAGNIATVDGARRLQQWGADAVKVGIAGGGACSTKHQTGFHVPMFSCVKECHEKGSVVNISSKPYYDPKYDVPVKIEVPIIADGGIKENGDIAKALVAGATLVMCGSLLAACIDGPGETVLKYKRSDDVNINGNYSWAEERGEKTVKRYHGSASERQKGHKKHIEGFEVELLCNDMTVAEKYQEITESLQSAVSYAGGQDLSAFKDVEWVEV